MTRLLIKMLQSARPPNGAIKNPGDVLGEEEQIARQLIREGRAELIDVGHGPGVIAPSFEGGYRQQTEYDSNAQYSAYRKKIGLPWSPPDTAQPAARPRARGIV